MYVREQDLRIDNELREHNSRKESPIAVSGDFCVDCMLQEHFAKRMYATKVIVSFFF